MSMTETDFLRHVLATVAYRSAKTMRGVPFGFAGYRPGPTSRTPVQIVAHMGDLFDWTLTLMNGEPRWNNSVPEDWDGECARFFAVLARCDKVLASGTPLKCELTRLFQGLVADALTHTGQLAMLRRLFGAPMKGESYFRSDIVIGRAGPDQTPADQRYEFD